MHNTTPPPEIKKFGLSFHFKNGELAAGSSPMDWRPIGLGGGTRQDLRYKFFSPKEEIIFFTRIPLALKWAEGLGQRIGQRIHLHYHKSTRAQEEITL